MPEPEAFVLYAEGLIAKDDSVTDENTRKFLGNFVDKYLDWMKRFV